MVLQELGSKLTSALRRLHTSTVVDKETIKAVVGEICRALLESDVNVQMVIKLRKNVEAKALAAGLTEAGSNAGAAQRRLIQKAVMDELTGMLDPKTPPYKMKKGKSNVVMFVGLQVRRCAHFRTVVSEVSVTHIAGNGLCCRPSKLPYMRRI